MSNENPGGQQNQGGQQKPGQQNQGDQQKPGQQGGGGQQVADMPGPTEARPAGWWSRWSGRPTEPEPLKLQRVNVRSPASAGDLFVPTQKPQMRVGDDCENCDNNYRSTARQFDPACAIDFFTSGSIL